MTRAVLILALAAVGCSGPSGEGRFTVTGPPRASFPPVGDVLESHCGSLDCHGSIARNMRVYGLYGLRINGITGQGSTTQEEYDATYTSVESIQPEVLAEILSQGGADPERWIVISKGNGREAHKGGSPIPKGSSGDVCVRSWLTGPLDGGALSACQDAAEYLAPQPP